MRVATMLCRMARPMAARPIGAAPPAPAAVRTRPEVSPRLGGGVGSAEEPCWLAGRPGGAVRGGGGSAGSIVDGRAVCAMLLLLPAAALSAAATSAAVAPAERADWLPDTSCWRCPSSAGVTRRWDDGRSRSTVGGRGPAGASIVMAGIARQAERLSSEPLRAFCAAFSKGVYLFGCSSAEAPGDERR